MAQPIVTSARAKFVAAIDRLTTLEARLTTPGTATPSSAVSQVRRDQLKNMWAKVDAEFEAPTIVSRVEPVTIHCCIAVLLPPAQVSGLSQSVAAQSKKLCHFSIRSPTKPGLQLKAAAYVLPELAGNLPSYPIPLSALRDLPNLPLADPTFYESSQIDVLIGADILPSILLSDKLLTKFWEVEDLPTKLVGESDSYCESNFLQTTTRATSGKYMVTLPFRDPGHLGSGLGYSRSIALAQFLRNENRLKRDSPLHEQYVSVIQEYSDLGHMTEVPPSHDSNNYYLPHHAVIKPDSTTTKLRVVFNASSPSANGTSLNDLLHAGPVLQSDLTLQILKWRYFRYAFNADITKMYRQIWVDPEHTRFQRILFRNAEGEIRDYELKTVTFGVNCAPFLAIRVLQQLSNDVQSQFPRASHIIRHLMYVDDVLAGADSTQDAQLAIRELQAALSSSGFPLRKWTANHKDVLAEIPTTSDKFFFVPPVLSLESSFTKREVLSQIAKLFDPAGWLAPFIVRSKIFMQEIWLQELEWDEKLPNELCQYWQAFLRSYSCLTKIRIPRWIGSQPSVKVEHHGFCDASEKAYGAAIYVRVEMGQRIDVHLLAAKTRVAPVKTVSLPRLELCGAVLLAEMATAILPSMPTTGSTCYYWTDSTIVLAWLNKPACHWTTFVANRVTKIAQTTETQKWSHVRSEHNPADLASRGQPRSQWPLQDQETPVIDLEQRAVKVHFTTSPPEDFLERFSTLEKALRVRAYVLRFLQRCRKLPYAQEIHPTSGEINEAERTLILETQRREYSQEYHSLREKRPVPRSSSILNLNPFMDQHGVIRSCGRVSTAQGLKYVERHPIILPYNCRLSRLLTQFTHRITLHGGSQLMVRLIRSKYWIPRIQKLMKGVERTSFSRPFTHTGIDYAGPFEIRNYTGRACLITKGYVCVFVCFSTKAIHLEPTSDLTTEKFLAAFARFVARRGCPQSIHSDNGKTFVGAATVLARDFLEAFKDSVIDAYTFEELSTLLSKIEACLNSRPLSPMSEDPTELLALTPGHFLTGGPLMATAEPEVKGDLTSIINRWQHLKALNQQFCRRWKEEYLKELHKRTKWQTPTPNLQIETAAVPRAAKCAVGTTTRYSTTVRPSVQAALPDQPLRRLQPLALNDAVVSPKAAPSWKIRHHPWLRSSRTGASTFSPTALVVLDTGSRTFETVALIDPCTPVSSIDESLAIAFKLPTTRVGTEKVCTATVRAKNGNFQVDAVLKVEPRLRVRTPLRPVTEAVRTRFDDIRLANERFHRPSTVSLVLGADVYQKVIQSGFLALGEGLPVAQSTVFGWIVSGACTQP
ncbi:uncharacterized protein LOC121404014 [Drosophila obscura]|uniref:uncharacterized protein LOC121404014 n=1 Tax=Drosophila obscura TaxID=7282 RepID=UPI001BB1E712|nr:uncharacterized protein LOC121404014 [Drosophila obscura]